MNPISIPLSPKKMIVFSFVKMSCRFIFMSRHTEKYTCIFLLLGKKNAQSTSHPLPYRIALAFSEQPATVLRGLQLSLCGLGLLLLRGMFCWSLPQGGGGCCLAKNPEYTEVGLPENKGRSVNIFLFLLLFSSFLVRLPSVIAWPAANGSCGPSCPLCICSTGADCSNHCYEVSSM